MINRFKATEKVARFIEAENTLVVEVDKDDTKDSIKKDAEKMLNVKVPKHCSTSLA